MHSKNFDGLNKAYLSAAITSRLLTDALKLTTARPFKTTRSQVRWLTGRKIARMTVAPVNKSAVARLLMKKNVGVL